MPARKDRRNVGGWSARPLPEVTGDFPSAADPARAGGTAQDLRRHTRPIHRLVTAVRVRRLPAGGQLLVPRGLRRPGQTVVGDDMPAARVQDQVPGELLLATRQSRVRQHKQDIRVLRWVQETVQHQAVEDVHRLLQLSTDRGHHRREDILLPRRAQPGSSGDSSLNEDRFESFRYRIPMHFFMLLLVGLHGLLCYAWWFPFEVTWYGEC